MYSTRSQEANQENQARLCNIFLLVVFWRLRYKLSLRDLAEMLLERGFTFTHEAARDWKARFAPLLADQLRTKRQLPLLSVATALIW
ncbi:IS6 family transposase [Ktedonobacteria bacterium brp13]|nr:IS6 family transposase [Ktedonobacteria bacterium brp13]